MQLMMQENQRDFTDGGDRYVKNGHSDSWTHGGCRQRDPKFLEKSSTSFAITYLETSKQCGIFWWPSQKILTVSHV